MNHAAINPSEVLWLGFIIVLIAKLYIYFKNKQEEERYQVDRRSKPIQKRKEWTKEELEQLAEENRIAVKKSFDEYYKKLLGDKEFVNKNTTQLEDFIINDELNHFDLHKLAQLNGIKVEMSSGWYDLTLDLMRELDKMGWSRIVGSIKEKFGELRFYADTPHDDILEKYTQMSLEICEKCGKPGEMRYHGYWMITLCDEHEKESRS